MQMDKSHFSDSISGFRDGQGLGSHIIVFGQVGRLGSLTDKRLSSLEQAGHSFYRE